MDRRTAICLLLALAGTGAVQRARATEHQKIGDVAVAPTEWDLVADALHTRWSNPGTHKLRLRELPTAANAIWDALENLVVHFAIARALGYPMPPGAEGDRLLQLTSKLLDEALRRHGRALTERRDLPSRLFGNCHDFALLAVSILREHGIPARLRVGYASYLAAGLWEDHWVCQHWTGARWATFDAQLGPQTRSRLNITFDVSDMPEGA